MRIDRAYAIFGWNRHPTHTTDIKTDRNQILYVITKLSIGTCEIDPSALWMLYHDFETASFNACQNFTEDGIKVVGRPNIIWGYCHTNLPVFIIDKDVDLAHRGGDIIGEGI